MLKRKTENLESCYISNIGYEVWNVNETTPKRSPLLNEMLSKNFENTLAGIVEKVTNKDVLTRIGINLITFLLSRETP